jgi:hypothetical protein
MTTIIGTDGAESLTMSTASFQLPPRKIGSVTRAGRGV